MIDWLEGDEEDRRGIVKRYSEDREQLLREVDLLHPHLTLCMPSEKVEVVLTDVCGFHVVDEPLCAGQLALCDFSSRTIIVNSHLQLGDGVDRELLRHSTLAHELGHIRLHWNEISEGCTLHYLGGTGQFADSRSYQREREADLYAALFLVPLEQLLDRPAVQTLLKKKIEGKPMGSGSLWSLIYREASKFKVSPTLMKRCLLDLGWIQQGPRGRSGLQKLKLRS